MKTILYKIWVLLVLVACLPVLAVVVTTPMALESQLAFGLITCLLLIAIGQVASQRVRLAMSLITALTATRYLYWRITETLVTDGFLESLLSLGLLAAECYAWLVLVLSFFQVAWPLDRKIIPLPKEPAAWPSVDVYVPTYNESLEVVRDTVLAAQNLDYPADKLNIYLLDDGKRPEFGAFASKAGVGYITRSDNAHAKAGNLNNALNETSGELICIFDCDHITTRAFLQATVGAFLVEDNLALLQTPHHFYSPDPFERNLVSGKEVPHEGELFYGPIQKGNDYWNATFFCGSCAVIRRSALEQIGGFAVETVTEDAHTALKLQRKGWATAYLGIPLAAGLATERLSLHIVQRARWARGMTQILRRDNPLLGRGLTLPQRLCYLSAMLHFQFPLARFVFLTAPLAYLLFDLNIIQASPYAVAVYVVPHLFAVVYTNAKIVGRYRYTFWNEIYETVLTFHLLKPSLVTLFNPNRGKFDVTEKGGLLDKSFFDFNVTRPHLFLLALLSVGVIWGVIRFLWWDPEGQQFSALVFNIAWASFSALFLMAAVAVGSEQKQIREYVRIDLVRDAVLHLESEYTFSTVTKNISMGGIQLKAVAGLPEHWSADFVEMEFDGKVVMFPVRLVNSDTQNIRLRFGSLNISQRRQLVKLVMGRADAWLKRRGVPQDQPLRSMWTVIKAVMGLFFQNWRNRTLFAGGDGGVKPTTQNAPLERHQRASSFRLWLGRIAIVLLIAIAVVSTQKAWSQPLQSNEAGLGESLFPALPMSEPRSRDNSHTVLPDVGVGSLGDLVFNAPVETSQQTIPLVRNAASGIADQPLRLQGNGAQAGLEFSIGSDKVPVSGELYLDLRHSEALLEGVSRLGISLNGIALKTVELDRFSADRLVVSVDIPSEMLVNYNTLLLTMEGQTLAQCNNILNEDIWLEVMPSSHLSVELQTLPPTADLASLPAPFFDESDMQRLQLPVVLPQNPSEILLSASAATASYFALQADFLGADFPVSFEQVPEQHAVVIGTPEQMPLGVQLPSINGPTILQLAHPINPLHRLLVVTGTTEQDVKQAALSLSASQAEWQGSSAEVEEALPLSTRKPYDAPKWHAIDAPIALADMTSNTGLTGQGLRPVPHYFSFRLPPNLFFWPGDQVVLDLGYQFPRGEWLDEKHSVLEVGLNGSFLGTFPVEKNSLAWDFWHLLGNDIRQERTTIKIPQERLYGNNQLSIYFDMAVNMPDAGCELGLPPRIETRISPDSSMDITNAEYFTALPQLSYWLSAGFPFTQQADLSETVLLLPEVPEAAEISAALGLAGRMSASTGYPTTHLVFNKGLELRSDFAQKDILVVSNAEHIENSAINSSLGLFRVQQENLTIQAPDWLGRMTLWAQAKWGIEQGQARSQLANQRPEQMLLGASSPLNSQRSIVVATAFDDEGLLSLTQSLDDPNVANQAVGDLVLIYPERRVAAYQVGTQTPRGDMVWHRLIRWYAGQYIIPMLLAMGLVVLLIAGLLYGSLKRRALRREGVSASTSTGGNT